MPKQTIYFIFPKNIADEKAAVKFVENHDFLKIFKLTDNLKDAQKIVVLPSGDGSINADDGKKIEHSLEKDIAVYLINPKTFSIRIVRSMRDLMVLTPEETARRWKKIGNRKESYIPLIRVYAQMK